MYYSFNETQGACKYYISTLGVVGGSEGNAYFAYVVRGDGGSRGKNNLEFLPHLFDNKKMKTS